MHIQPNSHPPMTQKRNLTTWNSMNPMNDKNSMERKLFANWLKKSNQLKSMDFPKFLRKTHGTIPRERSETEKEKTKELTKEFGRYMSKCIRSICVSPANGPLNKPSIKGYLTTNWIPRKKNIGKMFFINLGNRLVTFKSPKKMLLEQRDFFQIRKILKTETGRETHIYNFLKKMCKSVISNEMENSLLFKTYLCRFKNNQSFLGKFEGSDSFQNAAAEPNDFNRAVIAETNNLNKPNKPNKPNKFWPFLPQTKETLKNIKKTTGDIQKTKTLDWNHLGFYNRKRSIFLVSDSPNAWPNPLDRETRDKTTETETETGGIKSFKENGRLWFNLLNQTFNDKKTQIAQAVEMPRHRHLQRQKQTEKENNLPQFLEEWKRNGMELYQIRSKSLINFKTSSLEKTSISDHSVWNEANNHKQNGKEMKAILPSFPSLENFLNRTLIDKNPKFGKEQTNWNKGLILTNWNRKEETKKKTHSFKDSLPTEKTGANTETNYDIGGGKILIYLNRFLNNKNGLLQFSLFPNHIYSSFYYMKNYWSYLYNHFSYENPTVSKEELLIRKKFLQILSSASLNKGLNLETISDKIGLNNVPKSKQYLFKEWLKNLIKDKTLSIGTSSNWNDLLLHIPKERKGSKILTTNQHVELLRSRYYFCCLKMTQNQDVLDSNWNNQRNQKKSSGLTRRMLNLSLWKIEQNNMKEITRDRPRMLNFLFTDTSLNNWGSTNPSRSFLIHTNREKLLLFRTDIMVYDSLNILDLSF
jgi:hypothetical protein